MAGRSLSLKGLQHHLLAGERGLGREAVAFLHPAMLGTSAVSGQPVYPRAPASRWPAVFDDDQSLTPIELYDRFRT